MKPTTDIKDAYLKGFAYGAMVFAIIGGITIISILYSVNKSLENVHLPTIRKIEKTR